MQGPAFRTLNRTLESVFKSEQVFCNFRNSILRTFFRKFWKVPNRTNSDFSVNSECSETPVFLNFDPKTLKNRKLFPNLFPSYFHKIFASLKKPDISEKFPNFENRTIPNFAKMKSSENSVFRRAL
jgi:hypothetical protein